MLKLNIREAQRKISVVRQLSFLSFLLLVLFFCSCIPFEYPSKYLWEILLPAQRDIETFLYSLRYCLFSSPKYIKPVAS